MNNTEQYIQQFYQYIKVNDPLLLSKELIVECLNIKLFYWPHSSSIATHKGRYVLFLDNRLSMQQQWQDFGHEMYHYFFDETNYCLINESYANYGESKADYFAYHFCVPTFMLLNLKEVSVDVITRLFNVEYDFALRRFEMYQNKLLIGGMAHGAYSGTRKKQKI